MFPYKIFQESMININKKIILRIVLPILVFLLASFVVFWFVKSSEVRKNIKAAIELDPGSSVGKITASGFPFSHRIELENIKLKVNTTTSESTIVVKKIVAKSGVFSSNFKVIIDGDLEVSNSNNKITTVKFNQIPNLAFSIQGYKINKFSYSDNGYKVLDEKGDTKFYVGATNLEFDIVRRGSLQETSIKGNLANISSFDVFFSDNLATTPVNTEVSGSDLSQLPQETAQVNAIIEDKIETSRNINFDIKLSSRVTQNRFQPQTLVVNSLELSSPLFTIKANGLIGYSDQDSATDLTLKVENLDNILIYVRNFVASLTSPNLAIADNNLIPPSIPASPVSDPIPNVTSAANGAINNTPSVNVSNEIVAVPVQESYEQVIADFITNLAKSNPNSNDQIAEFRLQGNGSDLRINDMKLSDIVLSLPASVVSSVFNGLGQPITNEPNALDQDLTTLGNEQNNVDPALSSPGQIQNAPASDQQPNKANGTNNIPAVPTAVPSAPVGKLPTPNRATPSIPAVAPSTTSPSLPALPKVQP